MSNHSYYIPLLSSIVAAGAFFGSKALNAIDIQAENLEAQQAAEETAAASADSDNSDEPSTVITAEPTPTATPTAAPEVTTEPTPEATSRPEPTPEATSTPEPTPEVTSTTEPAPEATSTPEPQETQPADSSAADTSTTEAAAETYSVPTSYDNLSIPSIGYSASVRYSTDPTTAQAIVNTAGSAWIGDYDGHTVIGDHAYQGFSGLTSLPIGSTAYLTLNGTTRTLTLASRYYGYNTTEALYTTDWTDISSIWDGDVVMYTCTDSTGENVVLTFWY